MLTKTLKSILFTCIPFIACNVFAQEMSVAKDIEFLKYSWKKVATQMPDEWYSSAAAKQVAANVIFCQQHSGGWAKNKPYHLPLSAKDSAEVIKIRPGIGATIDNGATTTEMIFLAKVYAAQQDEQVYKSFEKAFNCLLKAQYKNGGWPQFYPYREGSYAAHITYNDNAMVNVLQLLRNIVEQQPLYTNLPITNDMRLNAKKAYDKGIDCILKTQIMVKGEPTVWCAQHDARTLKPAKARAYELPSFSGAESMSILQFLMEIDNPSPEIIRAITHAMRWFEANKLTGIKVVNKAGADGKRNMMVVEDSNAPPLLARFYDLETARPIFSDRDGIKKYSLAEIGDERRNGYSWYSSGFEELQKQYIGWKEKWGVKG